MIHVPDDLAVGQLVTVDIVDALGPDLVAAGVDITALDEDDPTQLDENGAWVG